MKHLIFDANSTGIQQHSNSQPGTSGNFMKPWFVRIHRKLQHDNPPKLTGKKVGKGDDPMILYFYEANGLFPGDLMYFLEGLK